MVKDPVSVPETPIWTEPVAQGTGGNEFTFIRLFFLGSVSASVLVGVIVLVIGDFALGPISVARSLGIVVGYGLISLVLAKLTERQLDCSTDAALVASYRVRFFRGMSFANSAALVGYVVELALGPWWVYFVGLVFSAVTYVRLAPTRRNLQAQEEALEDRGCGLSLISALGVHRTDP